MTTPYPNLVKAIAEVAFDNGAVFHGQTIESVLERVMPVLEKNYAPETLAAVDTVLGEMNQEELENFCWDGPDGRDNLPYHLQAANEVLDAVFDVL